MYCKAIAWSYSIIHTLTSFIVICY
uniref:Uncharacterized protein n=1 Tax=Anguilla anguilla TaxID=7936 RepID=A0A0E9TTJ8_ANGAN